MSELTKSNVHFDNLKDTTNNNNNNNNNNNLTEEKQSNKETITINVKDEYVFDNNKNLLDISTKLLDHNIKKSPNKVNNISTLNNITKQSFDTRINNNNITTNNFKKTNTSNYKSKSKYNSQNSKNIIPKKQNITSTNFKGRDDKVDADKYFKVKEENENLKKEMEKNNEKYKHLQTQLYSYGEKLLKERVHGDKKVIYLEEGCEIELVNLKYENDKLKDQLKKAKTAIKGMSIKENNLHKNNYGNSNFKNITTTAKVNADNNSTHNEYIKLIKELKLQLSTQDTEIKRLHNELYGPGSNKINKGLVMNEEYTNDLKNKNLQLNELKVKCDQLEFELSNRNKVLNYLEDNAKEYQIKIREEQKKILVLKEENSKLESDCSRIPQMLTMIEEYKKRESEAESRIKNLCEIPYIKEAENRGNVYKRLNETECALKEKVNELNNLKETSKENKFELEKLKKEYERLIIEKDKLKEDSLKLKITNEERSKNTKNFEDQLKLLSQYGEVDSNFTRILSMLKLKDDDTSWMKIDFFDKYYNDIDINNNNDKNKNDNLKHKSINNTEYLIKEIERLTQEKGELGRQLEVTKNLLSLQQKICDDLQKEKNEIEKISAYNVRKLKQELERISKKSILDRDKVITHKKGANKYASVLDNEIKDASQEILDNITEFTIDDKESVLGINENALDLYLGESNYNDILSNILLKDYNYSIKSSELMSFITVDFYMHPLQTSNIANGINPLFNLQLKYIVNEDDHFIKYINSNEGIIVTVYFIKDNKQFLLAKGNINLNELVKNFNYNDNKEIDYSSNIVNNICNLYYKEDTTILIGHISYKMRLRKSIIDTIKFYNEKMNLINNISNNQNLINKKAENNINYINYNSKNSGKAIQVTIMITQLCNLVVSGPPHEILPYIWYQFYKNEEHFSKTLSGNNPMVEDSKVYNVIYDNEFDDYIQNGQISFMILDDNRALEVKIKENNTDRNKNLGVDLVENPELEDLIGICNIKLKDLIIHDKINGNFPILNRTGHKAGEISLLIFWEEIDNTKKTKKISYERKAWEEELIIRLGEKLKNKKLTVESAFEFFNIDNTENLTISNFRNVLANLLRYDNSNKEIDTILDLIFEDSVFLSRLDFNKIFMPLIPYENNNISNVKNKNDVNITIKHQISNISNNNNNFIETINKSIDKKNSTYSENMLNKNKSEQINKNFINVNQNKDDVVIMNSNDSFNSKSIIHKNSNISKSTINNNNVSTTRDVKDILNLVSDYVKRTNKNSLSELFRNFDKNQSQNIDKREVSSGFKRLGILLNNIEIDNIWNEMTNNNSKVEKINLSMFKSFFEKYKILKSYNNNNNT